MGRGAVEEGLQIPRRKWVMWSFNNFEICQGYSEGTDTGRKTRLTSNSTRSTIACTISTIALFCPLPPFPLSLFFSREGESRAYTFTDSSDL